MNSNNCNKKSNCTIIFIIQLILIILVAVIFLIFRLINENNKKIFWSILIYTFYGLLGIFSIIVLWILIIAIPSESCDIKKNIVSKISFGILSCFSSSDCSVHQKCSWFKCKNKKVENKKCECNDDCVNNLWCNKEKCVPKRRIGEICCNDEMCLSQKCGDDNRCINSINSIGDINDSCRTSNDCMFNLWCDQNKCNNKKNDGDKCNNDDNCISGKCSSELYCLAKEDNKYYIPNNRGPCSSDSDCLNESVCNESVCKARVNIVENKKSCKK